MDLNEIINKATSGDLPAGAMGGGGFVMLLFAWRAKKIFRTILVLVALGLIGGAVWWHYHRQA